MVYKPHKFQGYFHKSGARFRSLFAGRRGGKTLAGTIEALWQADSRPCMGWIVAPTYRMLMDVNIPYVMQWLPASSIVNWSKQEKKLELTNGSIIAFRSADNPDSLRGIGLDWLWMDEACFMAPGTWDVLYPTLTDRQGMAWITTTPKGYDWAYEAFYKPFIEGNLDYEAWRFKTIDNTAVDGIEDMVDKARDELSDYIFRQEYEASFETFVGLVYPEFSEKTHVIPAKKFSGDALWFVGIDVGWTNPSAILFVVEDAAHNLYVVDEIYETGKTATELAHLIREKERGLGRYMLNGVSPKITNYIIDPASHGTSQSSKVSVFDQLVEAGIPVIDGVNDVRAGITRVTRFIRPQIEPALRVFNHCVNTIKEFKRYEWAPESKRIIEATGSTLSERPLKAFDHALDALRYVVMHRPDWYERERKDRYGRPIVSAGTFTIEDADPIRGVL